MLEKVRLKKMKVRLKIPMITTKGNGKGPC